MTVAQNVKRVREARGVSKTYIARKLDMSLQGYRYLEDGTVKLDVERLKVIADALGVEGAVFLDDKLTDLVITQNTEKA